MSDKPKSAPETAAEKRDAAKGAGGKGTQENGKVVANNLATPKKAADLVEIKKRMGYSEVGKFKDGVAIAQKSGIEYLFFLINEHGEVISGSYFDIKEAGEGFYWGGGEDYGQFMLIGHNGKQVNEKIYENGKFVSEGKLGVKEAKGKWYFIDTNGKELMKAKKGKDGKEKQVRIGEFDEVYNFNKGIAGVRNGPYWKFIKADGSKLNSNSYSRIDDFEDGVAHGKRGKVWYVIDLKGIETIAPKGEEKE